MKKNTYISLFSSAGVGCYGFKEMDFDCIVTNELLEKRLKIQKLNKKCKYESGYIEGDISSEEIKEKLINEIKKYKEKEKIKEIDVIIATPPCQGMSVANHHKNKDEIKEEKRNSLVIESIKIIKKINPNFFIFENVSKFLTTGCVDIDEELITIREAIEKNLRGQYNIFYKKINFKDYGSNSSRPRTLVLGTKKTLKEITPLDIFPEEIKEKKLIDVIGHLPTLNEMGEFQEEDIYHSFRNYKPHMRDWISGLKEGENAFDNKEESKIPHQIKNGKIVFNKNKNGDKYKRQFWDKVGPCIHTRNDILASQNTIHPVDDRVFSIRELMIMMTIPKEFKWTSNSFEELNALKLKDKKDFSKKNEMNIRQSIGEAVPTIIFRQIAEKIKKIKEEKILKESEIIKLIENKNLEKIENLIKFLKKSNLSITNLFKISELANANRSENSAYYTSQDICYSLIEGLPDLKKNTIRILEPAAGVGNFIPLLIKKYNYVDKLVIDVVDIDSVSLKIAQIILNKFEQFSEKIEINYINMDFLEMEIEKKYDMIIGNPPYKVLKSKDEMLKRYLKKEWLKNKKTKNMYSFFIEKALNCANYIAFIVPKSLIYSPEYKETRNEMEKEEFIKILDYNENAFNVKIETLGFVLKKIKKKRVIKNIEIISYRNKNSFYQCQDYIFDKKYPTWLLYRNVFFDNFVEKIELNVFKSYRDRSISKKDRIFDVKNENDFIKIIRGRNIKNNSIELIENYDFFITRENAEKSGMLKYLNADNILLFPNLTYLPRVSRLPKGMLAEGSVALLIPRIKKLKINSKQIEFFSTEEFSKYYKIARNYGTRSLNIDSCSVFYLGLKKGD